MADPGSPEYGHDHYYFSTHQQSNERRTWAVLVLTLVTMLLEIFSGVVFGSMALLADGWHMASHASAMGITALAYYLARKHKDNPKFTFGTGKIGDLAGYSSAILLLFIAIFMAYESIMRLIQPVSIHFNEAIGVASIGLVVNLVSAFILREHPHDADQEHHHRDHNLRSAYLHVLADALTSILAITALGLGLLFNWFFLDPVMGIVGAVLITRWSYGLMREAGSVLLDRTSNEDLVRKISESIKKIDGVRILDLHVWRLGPGHFGAIVSLEGTGKEPPEFFKQRLRPVKGLSHVTIEVNP